ncbi:unnamed protein product [Blepharisma stoltei]|uniref:J domain-containing protein n=1 Tax=Blepharisma stoltei TaxID=1481888 RepID=A0AAU9JS04_9CILI|nr:unnamed protein product [Blepharisma stoltei]
MIRLRINMRRFTSLEKVSYVKVPIQYPASKPPAPSLKDYQILNVNPADNNRDIVNAYRRIAYHLHPKKNRSATTQENFTLVTEAYDRIMLHRMSEQGIPQPYTEMYYPEKSHTALIKDFIEENSFFMPHVSENYLRNLVIFYWFFGVGYILNDFYDPFEIKKSKNKTLN